MKPLHLRQCASVKGRRGPRAVLVVCLFALLSSCTQTPTPTVETYQFDLIADTSTAPLIDELAAGYQAEKSSVTIGSEHAANTARALEALRAGQADLVSVSWLSDSEKSESALWYRPFARDAIVLIVHSTNATSGLTLLKLRDIFQGQILLWSELGGPPIEVIPISREDGAGIRFSFESLVMGRRAVTPTAVVLPSDKAVVEYVSRTPGAIGYVASAWLIPAVNLLAIEGVTPSAASVKDGRYLLARPFHLVTRNEPEGGLAEFVDWVRGEDGQAIIQRTYAPVP